MACGPPHVSRVLQATACLEPSLVGLRFHLPVKKEAQPLREIQTFRLCDESRFPHVFVCEWSSTSTMSEVQIVAGIRQRTQG